MDTRMHDSTDVIPRRGFFARIAGGAMALGLTGLASAPARAAAGAEAGPDWPGTLKGQHRQVVDAYAPNDGFPLAFAFTFLVTNGPASAGVVPATAVVVLRHTATPARARPRDVAEIQDRAVAQHSRSGDQGAGGEKPISAAEARSSNRGRDGD